MPRKKKPSQVAQAETPQPDNSFSPGMPSQRACAPVQITTASATYSSPESPVARNGRFPRSIDVMMSCTMRVPTCSACFCICSIRKGPWMALA